MAGDTRSRLLEGALETLRAHGIAGASARSIAATAGVNQALVFYHFGTVDELLTAAVRHGAQQQVSVYRDRFASITSLRELLDLGRSLRADERAAGNLAVLAQMLAGAQTDPRLRPATHRPSPAAVAGRSRGSVCAPASICARTARLPAARSSARSDLPRSSSSRSEVMEAKRSR